ncbi:MAG TPA: hypothetical protein VK878_25135 [Candidatus Deferrimicrobiaceae bacterium]|nr:hypothetical protein [Candidatus Deferrimicrobiaceae bacterium]
MLALLAPAPAPAVPVLVDTVVATVGAATVTAGDVALARALGLFGFTPTTGPIGAAEVDRSVRAHLVVDEANRLDIVVDEAEVEAAWRALAERWGGSAALAGWLADNAVEPAWARRLLRDDVRHERFVELRFRAFVFVLEEDVSAALGPGEHTPAARERAREWLRAEIAERRLAEWLEEAAQRVPVRRLLSPEDTVFLPWPKPPPRVTGPSRTITHLWSRLRSSNYRAQTPGAWTLRPHQQGGPLAPSPSESGLISTSQCHDVTGFASGRQLESRAYCVTSRTERIYP